MKKTQKALKRISTLLIMVLLLGVPVQAVQAYELQAPQLSATASTEKVVRPKATSIRTISGGKKSFVVRWKKQTKNANGYQIQYSLKKQFSPNKKTITIHKIGTVSKKVTGLRAGTTYYVRVRTFRVEDGKKIFSKWSATKKVKTKKAASTGTESVATSVTKSTSKSSASEVASSGGGTVYITNTGTKYHADGCRYLAKSKYAIGLNDAISRGYSACSVCLR